MRITKVKKCYVLPTVIYYKKSDYGYFRRNFLTLAWGKRQVQFYRG